jgi:hypothetical protein
MIGFISSLVTHSLIITLTLAFNTGHTALSLIYTFQFTVAHALGFSVSTIRLVAMYLNTETSASNHYGVSLLFRLQSLWNLGTKNSSGLTPPAYD